MSDSASVGVVHRRLPRRSTWRPARSPWPVRRPCPAATRSFRTPGGDGWTVRLHDRGQRPSRTTCWSPDGSGRDGTAAVRWRARPGATTRRSCRTGPGRRPATSTSATDVDWSRRAAPSRSSAGAARTARLGVRRPRPTIVDEPPAGQDRRARARRRTPIPAPSAGATPGGGPSAGSDVYVDGPQSGQPRRRLAFVWASSSGSDSGGHRATPSTAGWIVRSTPTERRRHASATSPPRRTLPPFCSSIGFVVRRPPRLAVPGVSRSTRTGSDAADWMFGAIGLDGRLAVRRSSVPMNRTVLRAAALRPGERPALAWDPTP